MPSARFPTFPDVDLVIVIGRETPAVELSDAGVTLVAPDPDAATVRRALGEVIQENAHSILVTAPSMGSSGRSGVPVVVQDRRSPGPGDLVERTARLEGVSTMICSADDLHALCGWLRRFDRAPS